MGAARPGAIARHPHLATEPSDPSTIRVDCHVHTMWSGDATTTPDELATAVVEAAIDVVCITDHSTIAGAKKLSGLLPCQVVVGQEQRTPEGEVIGLFLEERLPAGYRSADEAAKAIRAQGGLVYVPHLGDPTRHSLETAVAERLAADGLVDVIETLNGKTSLASLSRGAAETCERIGAASGAGSDAHVPDAIGAAYVEMSPFEDAAGFLDALVSGRVVGHHYDKPRRWQARVLPSLTAEG